MARQLRKRRTYVVDRGFQYGMVGTFLLATVVALAMFSAGTVLYYWASSMVGDNLFKEFIDIRKHVYVIEEDAEGNEVRKTETRTVEGVKRWEIIVPPILINNLFIMIVISVIGIFYSHRIIGPVYRINRDLQRALDGEEQVKIVVRDYDKFSDLAARINRLLSQFYELKRHADASD